MNRKLGVEFLQCLTEEGVERLEPVVTPEGIIYNNLEYCDESWKSRNEQLQALADEGYFRTEDFDRVILCPYCDSPHVYSKYACPSNRSIFLKKVQLLRHNHDGFQGELTEFVREGRLVCPSCGWELGDPDDKRTWDERLEEVGYSFECEKTGARFERPLVLHHCVTCGEMFDYKTARYMAVKAYILTKKAYDEVIDASKMEHLVDPIVSFLRDKGFEIRHGYSVKGRSGSIHRFDLAGLVDDSLLVFDYSFGDSEKLVSLLGKKLDSYGVEVVLLDFSGNEELFNLGKIYNIPIINAGKKEWSTTLEEIIMKLRKEPKKTSRMRRLLEGRK